MMRRLEAREAGLVLEWDSETGDTGLALTSGGPNGRARVFSQLGALQRFLDPIQGLSWVDLEVSERHRAVCGVSGMALVWRARFLPASGADVLAEVVVKALGGEMSELE